MSRLPAKAFPRYPHLALILVAALLVACGGGSSSDSDSAGGDPEENGPEDDDSGDSGSDDSTATIPEDPVETFGMFTTTTEDDEGGAAGLRLQAFDPGNTGEVEVVADDLASANPSPNDFQFARSSVTLPAGVAAGGVDGDSLAGVHLGSVVFNDEDGQLYRVDAELDDATPEPARVSSESEAAVVCGVIVDSDFASPEASRIFYSLPAGDDDDCAWPREWRWVTLGDDVDEDPRKLHEVFATDAGEGHWPVAAPGFGGADDPAGFLAVEWDYDANELGEGKLVRVTSDDVTTIESGIWELWALNHMSGGDETLLAIQRDGSQNQGPLGVDVHLYILPHGSDELVPVDDADTFRLVRGAEAIRYQGDFYFVSRDPEGGHALHRLDHDDTDAGTTVIDEHAESDEAWLEGAARDRIAWVAWEHGGGSGGGDGGSNDDGAGEADEPTTAANQEPTLTIRSADADGGSDAIELASGNITTTSPQALDAGDGWIRYNDADNGSAHAVDIANPEVREDIADAAWSGLTWSHEAGTTGLRASTAIYTKAQEEGPPIMRARDAADPTPGTSVRLGELSEDLADGSIAGFDPAGIAALSRQSSATGKDILLVDPDESGSLERLTDGDRERNVLVPSGF